jgi:hypothetical protein
MTTKTAFIASNSLFSDVVSPRPRRHDAPIVREAAEVIADRILGWFDETLSDEDLGNERKRLIDWLVDTIAYHDNGYTMAKDIERELGYEADRQMVDILESVGPEIVRIHQREVAKWVESWGIELKFKGGDKVSYFERQDGYGKIQKVIGEVSGCYEKTASYSVYVPEKGHVRNGAGTHGVIVNCEDVFLEE